MRLTCLGVGLAAADYKLFHSHFFYLMADPEVHASQWSDIIANERVQREEFAYLAQHLPRRTKSHD